MFYTVYLAGVGDHDLVKGPFETVSEAAEKRDVSGDLVCRKVGNGYEVVTDDDSWLFDWELSDPNSYAYRCLKREKVL